MSEALQEARAYTAVNEVMVFKGGRGMNVSKKDLPVFQAKGWKLKEELEEANMKRILQALQDKLSKEGGAAGFDDLKKVAKSMGLNLTPQMLRGMPGIKQHRDGDYILEELEEAMVGKRIIQGLQDKLRKEGGAAGFEDLKKTAKSMGLDLTPQMLKNMPGIKQHRDGDYILEAIVGNPNLSKFMFMFKDTSSVFGGMRQQGKLITAKNKAEATREFKRQ